MLLASAVVVWEWLNEHGRWRPYSPAVSHHIEEVTRLEPRGGSVGLGRADSRLSPYIIDLQSMHQFRQDTGTIRPVRRSFYDPTSAPGQGWIWEWENDAGLWIVFDMEVNIALQTAKEQQQPLLDLTPLGFGYLVDFQTMTQFNRQTQRRRRIQRRSDMVYPFVYGPLPNSSQTLGTDSGRMLKGVGGSTGALLGVGISGSTLNRKGSAVYPSGTLSVSSLGPIGQMCACQQCMLVMSIKANPTASQTLGRRSHATKSNDAKSSFGTIPKNSKSLSVLNSHSHTLPDGLSLNCSPSEKPKNYGDFAHSMTLLTSGTASLSMSSSRQSSPPVVLPPTLPLSNQQPSSAKRSTSSTTLVPTATLVNMSTSATSSTTTSATLPQQRSSACAAPLPPRASLAGLSQPALQKIAMAQSQALIASGVPTVPVKNLNNSGSIHPALAGITGILMSAAGLPVCLTRAPKLVLHPPPVNKSDIKPVPGIGHCCRKTTKKQALKSRTPEQVVKRYLQKVRNPPEGDCTICMEALGGPSGYKGPGVTSVSHAEFVGRLAQCGHLYHLHCLVALYNNGNKDGSLLCPTCKTTYGVKTGNQPPGKMEYHVIPHSLPGHPDCKCIRIIYSIPPGIQGPGHPNPGEPFTARGFPHHCYLPDNEKGRKVLKLLLVAWDRRLIFSVGNSSSAGESDTVIWNEIHHKTEFGSNLTGHGFPDSGYLDNVLEELKAQGITEDE